MPSSPEPLAWEPLDLAAPAPESSPPRSHQIFEVRHPAHVPAELLAPARAAAEAAGYATGFARGVQAGRAVVDVENVAARKATEARAAQLQRAIAAIEAAARSLETRMLPMIGEVEELILAAGFDLAEALVGARLRDDEARGTDALRRVLALAPDGEPVRVHLNPVDLRLLRAADLPDGVELVADATQEPGDAVAHSGATEIDARIGAALDRARAHLRPGDAP